MVLNRRIGSEPAAAAADAAGAGALPAGDTRAGEPGHVRFSTLVRRLMATEGFVVALALITAPLAARALGPTGRGELAAILVTLTFVPSIAALGLAIYAQREAARGADVSRLVGSLGAVSLVTASIGMLLALPIANFVSDGREVVRTFVLIGLLMLPFSLAGNLLAGISSGLELWSRTIAVRLIPPVIGAVGVVTLYLADALTVATAATLAIVSSVLQLVPVLPPVLRAGRPRVDRATVVHGLKFGIRAWVGALASKANVRLDQLMMTRLVPTAELGLYAVAVSISSVVGGLVTAAVWGPLGVRTAKGDPHLVSRALRVSLLTVVATGAVIAAILPLVVPVVFGERFSGVVEIAHILIVAVVAATGMQVLTSALTGAGRPGAGAKAQLIALAITVPGLILLLPSLGAVGAALVSLVSYNAAFLFLLVVARRHFGGGYGEYLLPRRSDFAFVGALLRRSLPGQRGRGRG